MTISRYTFCFHMQNTTYYLYNTLSNALIEVDAMVYEVIEKCKQHKQVIDAKNFDPELWQLMVDKFMVTDNDEDDFLAYKARVIELRTQKDFMHLTIAPTMECHFDCHYCFEENKTKGNITEAVMDSIVKYVCSNRALNTLRLTWFGGEPLIAIHQIQMLYEKLKHAFIASDHAQRTIVSDIITTGYALNEEVIKILQEINIVDMQITLDGDKTSHNRIKHTTDCDDAFSRTLENIDLLTKVAPQIHITFRINLTKQNIDEYVPLYHYLMGRYKGANIGIAPAFVMDRKSKHKMSVENNYFFNRRDATKYVLNLFHQEGIHSPWLLYPQQACSECAIRNQSSISFDPEGYAYKCWEIIGERKYAIGQLDGEGNLININPVALNRQLFGADTLSDSVCSKCSYLPICNGGCPLHRIQNEFEGWMNDCCSYYKEHLPDFMKIHLLLKKAGFNN